MELNKDSPIIKNLFRKRDLLAAGDPEHEKIGTALIILGGCMGGVCGGGTLIALNTLELMDSFDVAVTVSTGSAIGAYGLAGYEQARIGTSIYYEDCFRHNFIDFSRFFSGRGPLIDIDFIEWMFRQGGKTGGKKLDTGAIIRNRTKFFVGITNSSSGEGFLVNAKQAQPDMISVLTASVAMPGLYGRSRTINGIRGIDGGIGLQFPIKETVDRFHPTDILVIANCSQRSAAVKDPSLAELAVRPLLFRNLPAPLRKKIYQRFDLFNRGMTYLLSAKDINFGMIWGSGDVKLLTRNPKKLRRAAQNSAQKTLGIFGEPDKKIQLL